MTQYQQYKDKVISMYHAKYVTNRKEAKHNVEANEITVKNCYIENYTIEQCARSIFFESK